MENTRRKPIITIMTIVLVTVITAFSAFAILSSIADRNNGFKIGSQTIEISEDKFDLSSGDIIEPNKPLVKNPTITNIGTVDCYVRAYIGYENINKNNVEIALNEGWILSADGYYYFPQRLSPKESVELFNSITVHDTTRLEGRIFIYAESVDANDNDFEHAWQVFGIFPGIGG